MIYNLINQIHKKKTKYNDYEVSPKIRQTLQHWGYPLQKSDVWIIIFFIIIYFNFYRPDEVKLNIVIKYNG
tara:strand:- start:141 stop:353 length:213 start_codon:yes stop_codon:yes gene_type:complete